MINKYYTRYSVIDGKVYTWNAKSMDEPIPDDAEVMDFNDDFVPFPVKEIYLNQ